MSKSPFPTSYTPNTQVWFIIRDEDGRPAIKNGLVETTVMTTYVNKDGIAHEVRYLINECVEDEDGRRLEIELDDSRVYGSKKEAEAHMPQLVK